MLSLGAMFDHKHTLGNLAAQLARRQAGALRDALVPLGLLPAQFTCLAEIAQDEGMTQKQLVDRLGLEQPGVARTLGGLEALGWLERRSAGGRAQGLYLTARAREALPRALALAEGIDRQALSHFSRTERALLLDQLAELAAEP